MSKLQATSKINLPGGTTTIGAALDAGELVLRKVDNFYSARSASGIRTAYFAEVPDTTDGFEVSRALYLSRTEGKGPVAS